MSRNFWTLACLVLAAAWGVFVAVWSIVQGFSVGAGVGGLCIVAGIYGFVAGSRS